jgi:hypothetical protein
MTAEGAIQVFLEETRVVDAAVVVVVKSMECQRLKCYTSVKSKNRQ